MYDAPPLKVSVAVPSPLNLIVPLKLNEFPFGPVPVIVIVAVPPNILRPGLDKRMFVPTMLIWLFPEALLPTFDWKEPSRVYSPFTTKLVALGDKPAIVAFALPEFDELNLGPSKLPL